MSDIYLEVIKTLTVVKTRNGMKTIEGGSVNLICNKEKSKHINLLLTLNRKSCFVNIIFFLI